MFSASDDRRLGTRTSSDAASARHAPQLVGGVAAAGRCISGSDAAGSRCPGRVDRRQQRWSGVPVSEPSSGRRAAAGTREQLCHRRRRRRRRATVEHHGKGVGRRQQQGQRGRDERQDGRVVFSADSQRRRRRTQSVETHYTGRRRA